jgi:hypothetical protein
MIIQSVINSRSQARIVVTEQNSAKGAMEINVLVAVDIPYARSKRLRHKDGVGINRRTLP